MGGRVIEPGKSPAARRWLVRYVSEGTPGPQDVAKVTAPLAKIGNAEGDPRDDSGEEERHTAPSSETIIQRG